ncbi:MAG: type II toxin-antitoxin system VapC family toxin [Thermodesulfovibrionales bacterium]|nr:type II toxin-antitoxin system VapC family toxin [Thermodesulfovibrionales bacterium]
MESIFVDTGAWFALADEDDAHHKDAASIFPSLLQSYKELVTSNLVVAESYILILKGLGHNAAVDFLDHMNGSPRIKRLHATFDIEKEAEEILKRYIDQDFSYTDAVSFSIMNKFKIKKAFTYDKHFQTMGFVMV